MDNLAFQGIVAISINLLFLLGFGLLGVAIPWTLGMGVWRLAKLFRSPPSRHTLLG
jgi:hypothetical protein